MIPILLNKNKTLQTLVADLTGGIGEISGAYDGIAVEEANGIKELSFKLPINSPRFSELTVGSYLKAKVDEYHGLQIYEVYRITKPINGIVTVYAQHISYILGKATVKPFTATGITQVTQGMISNLVGTFPFTFQTDIVNTQSEFVLDIPMSFRKAIGGWKGSILDVFGGELDWDNLTVKLLAHRGTNRGVKVEYGKNLTDLTQEESIANVYDAVIGYAVLDDVTYVGDIQKITTTNSPRTQNVDFSSNFDYNEELTPEQIKTRLNSYALAYAQNNDIGKPNVNLKISFEVLSKFEEYQDIALFERVALFDRITVLFSQLGVEAKAKVIKTEYDFINEKMLSVELGDAKTNLLGLVNDEIESQINNIDFDTNEINEAIGFLDTYIENLSKIITNSLGLFYTQVEKSGGGYQYYLHNKPTLAESQYQWTINAGGFALSQDYGQTWSAGIDSEGNAVFNSLSANIVNALQVYGSYIQGSEIVFGNPTDASGKYITAKPYKTSNVFQGVSFDGSGTIRMQPQEQFIVNNMSSGGSIYNTINFSHSSTANIGDFSNRQYSNGNLFANLIRIDADDSTDRIHLYNYAIGKIIPSNYLLFSSTTSDHVIAFYNRLVGQDTAITANYFYMSSNATRNNFTLSNYNIAGNDSIANTLYMYSSTATNQMQFTNDKIGSSSVANQILFQSSSTATTGNSLYVYNYAQNANRVANDILLNSKSTERSLSIENYKNGTNVANKIEMASNNTATTGTDLHLINYYPSAARVANQILFDSATSDNSLYLENYNSSGTLTNYVRMNSASKQMYIWSSSDLKLYSDGAVRIKSDGSQNVQIIAADDMDLQCSDKFYISGKQLIITIGGVKKEAYFSGTYLRIKDVT